MVTDYQKFLNTKRHIVTNYGRDISKSLIHNMLFNWQQDIVVWAVKKGRGAIFLDTGLGKTYVQLEWARLLNENTLIIAPLSVARQTTRLAKNINVEVKYVRHQSEITDNHKMWITNYEMIESFDFSKFGAVVLDESSILKGLDSKTRKKLTELCANIKYKLCCTATPAPNDYTEIGNHAEYLGICTISEMLATFFINANKEHTLSYGDTVYRKKGTNKGGTEWRIKHHAEEHFFEWLASWAITMTKPSDLGYDDDGFILPPLNIIPTFIETPYKGDQLFFTKLHGISDRAKIRQLTLNSRLQILRTILDNDKTFVINLQYVDKRTKERIQQGLLQEEQGEGKDSKSGILSAKQGNDKSETEQWVHEKLLRNPQREMGEKITREASGIQSEQANKICDKSRLQGVNKEENKRLGKGQSAKGQSSESKCIQHDIRGVSDTFSEAKQSLCDMRVFGHDKMQNISASRSLPQNRDSEGVALHKLQPGDRKNEGQSPTIKESSNVSGNQWVIWCGLDSEQRALEALFKEKGITYTSVFGSLSLEEKIKRIEGWVDNNYQVIISKTKVCGFGMNFQQSHNMIFFGLNDSWEAFYQAIRREWRYGQTQPVNVYVIMSDMEAEIYNNVMRKDAMAKRLRTKLIEQINKYERKELGMNDSLETDYTTDIVKGDGYVAMLGDSCERLKEINENSIDLSIYSPPFADLFTYTASERDLGNSANWAEFFSHYKFIIQQVLRVTKPGRITCVHTSDIPAIAQKDGYIGIKDFPGEVIRAYEKEGWTFIGRALVQKNPQSQAIRTKGKALLFVQLRKDSTDSRPALIDHVLLFKKDGDNVVPVTPVKNGEIDNETWIEWANGIWLGIRETETLQFTRARGVEDEKHICPLQLGTIERCLKLYSNPDEMILDPFGGIGSTGYMALKLGRRATIIELKKEYFNVAISNLVRAKQSKTDLFSNAGIEVSKTLDGVA
jgi:DNA modification methylase